MRPPSIARRVASMGAALLIVALALVGVGTGVALHLQQVEALDQVLLTAAHGRAHPDVPVTVEVEHSRAPVETWLLSQDADGVPDEAVQRVRRRERPVFTDAGDLRMVLLPFEVEHGRHRQRHDIAIAAASRVRWSRSIGPFTLIYGLLATLTAALGSLGLAWIVRRGLAPVRRARDEAERIVGFDPDRRLPVDGPEEIDALLRALNALLDRLDAAHHAQTRFTAEAAHELRTPVATMLGELEVTLRAPRSAEDYREALSSMRDDVERLRRLVEALTALARLDAGQLEHDREPIRAGELAMAALQLASPPPEAPITLTIEADPELDAHAALLEVALANLIRNAARHAPGQPATLTVRQEGHDAVFDVDDAGPGVPAEQREAVFDRFARGGEARAKDREGLGLGLPVAREIARRHGGDCVLLPSPLGGARARLRVPASTLFDAPPDDI